MVQIEYKRSGQLYCGSDTHLAINFSKDQKQELAATFNWHSGFILKKETGHDKWVWKDVAGNQFQQ